MTSQQYPIPNWTKFTLEVDWRFATHKSLANRIHMRYIIKALPTNDVHHKLIMDGYAWMVEWVKKEWGITRSNRWWENMVQIKWPSHSYSL